MSQAFVLIDSGSPVALTSATVFPTLPGAVTGTGNAVAGQTTLADLVTYIGTADGPFIMTAATATPSAFSSTTFEGFSSTTLGAAIMGYGTTNDVTLVNRAGTAVIGITANTTGVTMAGALAVTGAITGASASLATTITSATPATQRLTLSEITCTPATTFAVAAGGSLAGVRGSVVVSAGKTFTDGFLYGTQGKVTLAGTMDETSAARIAGVIGQVDITGTVTDGQVSCVWADLQGTPTLTDPTQVNLIRATNSSNAEVNAILFGYGEANLFAQLGADGGAPDYFSAVAPSSLAASLKITVQGTDYYVALYSAAS